MKCFYQVVKDIEQKTHEPIVHKDGLECLEEEQPVCKTLDLKMKFKKFMSNFLKIYINLFDSLILIWFLLKNFPFIYYSHVVCHCRKIQLMMRKRIIRGGCLCHGNALSEKV
jgi:hypothetical protein